MSYRADLEILSDNHIVQINAERHGDRRARVYLNRPYSRALIPDAESGTFTAKMLEFPGCIAQGASPAEAYQRLEAAAESWIEAALEMGQEIPAPLTKED